MTARWTDLAEWRGPTVNHGGSMEEQRGLVLHIAQGTYEGTIAWQKNPAAKVSSHFVVDVDGTIAQVVEVDVTAWTQIEGNGHWLSAENAGHTPHALTAAQVEANAQLLARCHREFGVPLQVATSPDGRGLGHHSMGAENGVNWGHSDCPGPNIIAQKPSIVARAIEIINGGSTMTAPTPQQNAKELMSGLQEDNHDKGYTGKVGITAGTDLGSGADAARSGWAQSQANATTLTEILTRLDALPAQIAAAVVAALPPTGGITTSGDFEVTGTLHAVEAP